ncbi:MAG: BON domain-containing protein [Parachlamydiales bacterium]|jgi:osmotically-inducible protein OsmY
MTIDGIVTLREPVNSVLEKDTILQKVTTVSGVRNVDNQLEVVPSIVR